SPVERDVAESERTGLERAVSILRGTGSSNLAASSNGVPRSPAAPVLGREVVERVRRIAVLGQAIGRSLVFDLIGFDKGFQGRNGILLGLGHPDLLQRTLGLGVQALWQLVQDVRGLVHPAALLAGCRPHLAKRLPEAERTVSDRNLRPSRQAAAPHI